MIYIWQADSELKSRLKVRLLFNLKKTVDWGVDQIGFDLKVDKEYEFPLNGLVSEFQLGINEKSKRIDLSCGLTIH